jgi:hypothetical protein
MELDAWLVPFRRFWSKHVDALERHLDQMDDPPHRAPTSAPTSMKSSVKTTKKKGKKRP